MKNNLSDKIKNRLMEWCKSNPSDITIPNFFIEKFEMDVFKLTVSDICVEYEIKISRSDYFNDFKKCRIWNKGQDIFDKHKFILNGERLCNKFFFVVPEGLIKKEEVPEKCGLIYYEEQRNSFYTVKPASFLHRRKLTNDYELLKKLMRKCAFREQHWKQIYLNTKLMLEYEEKQNQELIEKCIKLQNN